MLKVYIENISADGITFSTSADGLKGICKFQLALVSYNKGRNLGRFRYGNGKSLYGGAFPFFGSGRYCCVSADGTDIVGLDLETIMGKALEEVEKVCLSLKIEETEK